MQYIFLLSFYINLFFYIWRIYNVMIIIDININNIIIYHKKSNESTLAKLVIDFYRILKYFDIKKLSEI